MESLRIIALCVMAAIAYGILHDQVTARVCIEYFTIGHPHLIDSTSPTLLALAWGVVATWWAGLFIGVLLAIGARSGARPPVTARQLRSNIGALLLVMAFCAVVAGTAGYLLATNGLVVLDGPLRVLIPVDRHARFIADLWAHLASYASGFVGGIALSVRTYRRRGRVVEKESDCFENSLR